MNHKAMAAGFAGLLLLAAVISIANPLYTGRRAASDAEARVFRGLRYRTAMLAFAPDGGSLASAGGTLGNAGEVHVWDAAGWTERLDLLLPRDSAEAVAFSADGKLLATAAYDGTVTVWDARSGIIRQVFHQPREGVCALVFTDEGRSLAVAGMSEAIWIWDLSTGHERIVRCGALGPKVFSPDGRRIAAGNGSDGSMILCDLVTGRRQTFSPRHNLPVLAIAVSPDGTRVASVDRTSRIAIWDVSMARLERTLEEAPSEVTSLAFSADGKTLATGSRDHVVRLWEIATGRQMAALVGHKATVGCVTFAPGGKMLASGSYDRSVRLWRIG